MNKEDLYRYLDQRLQNRQPRRVIQPTLQEAGVLVAVTDESDPKVLLTRRSQQLSSHRGEVAFPGGKKDLEDRDIILPHCVRLQKKSLYHQKKSILSVS